MIRGVGGTPQDVGNSLRPGVGGIASQEGVKQSGKNIPDGAFVKGTVKGHSQGVYSVKIGSQVMTARSNLPLFVGQRFQAIWDSSGDVPILRLRAEDAALISSFKGLDRDAAMMLLSKGLPINDELLYRLRREARRFGDSPQTINSIIELMARGERVNSDNVNLMSWYLALGSDKVKTLWKKLRESLKERTLKGEDPLSGLKDLKEGKDDIGRFLRAHGMVSKPPKEAFSSAELNSSWWPVSDDDESTARVSLRNGSKGDRIFHLVNFDMEGTVLGPVLGRLESDGRSLMVAIKTFSDESRRLIEKDLPYLRDDLRHVGLALQYLGVDDGEGSSNKVYRHLDMEA